MSRLAGVFDRLRAMRAPGLVAYITAGDPDLAQSRGIIRALSRGGAGGI